MTAQFTNTIQISVKADLRIAKGIIWRIPSRKSIFKTPSFIHMYKVQLFYSLANIEFYLIAGILESSLNSGNSLFKKRRRSTPSLVMIAILKQIFSCCLEMLTCFCCIMYRWNQYKCIIYLTQPPLAPSLVMARVTACLANSTHFSLSIPSL